MNNEKSHKFCSYCSSSVSFRLPKDDNRKRIVCDKCGTIFYSNPKIVTGCLLTWEDKVLMCKRATEPQKGLWTLPAGFLENQETVEEGARRETLEEANARGQNLSFYMMCDLVHISQVYMIYKGDLVDGKFKPGIESEKVELFKEEDIPWKGIAFTVIAKTLKYYFEDRKKGQFRVHFDKIDKRKKTN